MAKKETKRKAATQLLAPVVSSWGNCHTAIPQLVISYKSLHHNDVVNVLLEENKFQLFTSTLYCCCFIFCYPNNISYKIWLRYCWMSNIFSAFLSRVQQLLRVPKYFQDVPEIKIIFIKIQRHYLHFFALSSKDRLCDMFTKIRKMYIKMHICMMPDFLHILNQNSISQ